MAHRGQPVGNNAAPGTGTQYAVVADEDDDTEDYVRINGTGWEIGRDYIDSEIQDVAKLTKIVRKSSLCSTGDAEDGEPILCFEYERYERDVEIYPNRSYTDVDDRFGLRYHQQGPRP